MSCYLENEMDRRILAREASRVLWRQRELTVSRRVLCICFDPCSGDVGFCFGVLGMGGGLVLAHDLLMGWEHTKKI